MDCRVHFRILFQLQGLYPMLSVVALQKLIPDVHDDLAQDVSPVSFSQSPVQFIWAIMLQGVHEFFVLRAHQLLNQVFVSLELVSDQVQHYFIPFFVPIRRIFYAHNYFFELLNILNGGDLLS